MSCLARTGRGRRDRGRGKGPGGRRGRGRSAKNQAQRQVTKVKETSPSEVSAATSDDADPESEETARVLKRVESVTKKKAMAKDKANKKRKCDSNDSIDEAFTPVEGLRSSSLSDYLGFLMNRVMNTDEFNRWKCIAKSQLPFTYAEFCAGMGTGTMAIETGRFYTHFFPMLKFELWFSCSK